MIVRKRIYQCDHCPTRMVWEWAASYPDTVSCRSCHGTARIIGFSDVSSAHMYRAQQEGAPVLPLFGHRIILRER